MLLSVHGMWVIVTDCLFKLIVHEVLLSLYITPQLPYVDDDDTSTSRAETLTLHADTLSLYDQDSSLLHADTSSLCDGASLCGDSKNREGSS